ncbi:GIY-YIG nuclease family protein, partial [Salmonella enterica]|nr:GIY-YIG nuclease family protein [Salmonella enterica]
MKKQTKKKTYTMYILELEDNCYYIGITKFLGRSMDKHHQGKCSWTKLHKPLKIQESYYVHVISDDELPSLVKEKANEYAQLYGIENVGYWQKVFREYYVYVWELEGGNYYIGMTVRLKNRNFEHISKRGSDWTKKHKPIKLIEKTNFLSDDINYVYRIENVKTFEYMFRYGIDKVRGGTFSTADTLYKSIILKYIRKYKYTLSVYEEIMTYIRPELVPNNLWGLVRIHKNDLYKNISSLEKINELLNKRNIVIDAWPYDNDTKKIIFACWVLRGFNPEFACYF